MSAMYQTFQNTPIFQTAWRDFLGSKWTDEVNVRDFIQNNYTQYDGDESFLAAPTSATHLLWERLQKLQKEEHEKGGVLECETEIVSSLTAYGPGYIDPELKDLERIVGLQTDKPLKRAFMPFGGIKMAEEAAETYGYKVNEKFHKIFTEYHKTHNQAVFDAYTPEMKAARLTSGSSDTASRIKVQSFSASNSSEKISRFIAAALFSSDARPSAIRSSQLCSIARLQRLIPLAECPTTTTAYPLPVVKVA